MRACERSMCEMIFHATTIVAVKKGNKVAVAGDGQVTFGERAIMKANARKVRRLYHGKILAGFAGSVADAFTLFEKFEVKLESYSRQNSAQTRGASPCGRSKQHSYDLRQWRSHRAGRRLHGNRLGRILRTRRSSCSHRAQRYGCFCNCQGSSFDCRRYLCLYEP